MHLGSQHVCRGLVQGECDGTETSLLDSGPQRLLTMSGAVSVEGVEGDRVTRVE